MSWTDEQLMAWIDGELSEEESRAITVAVERDPALAERVATQRRIRGRLAARFDPIADEPVPEKMRALLEGDAKTGADVTSLEAARTARERRRISSWGVPQFAAMAASLAIGVLGSQMLFVGEPAGPRLAVGDELAAALETRLASAQPTDAEIRLGFSFRDTEGDYCRTFDAPDLGGVACKREEGWRIAMAIAREDDGYQPEYRQAGAADPLIAEYAQSIMTGEGLDAGDERAARATGWR